MHTPKSTPSSPLRATVTADASGASQGDPVPILVDGAETPVTANGLAGYTPTPDDRLLVQKVGGAVEVQQFLRRAVLPGGNNVTYSTTDPTGTPGDGDVWFKQDGSGTIIGQWVGSGGTWQPVTLDNEVIANLDAGKITTGTLSGITITAQDGSGNTTVDIDGSTGDVTVQGEFGTAPAGDVGVHISSMTFSGLYGLATYPVIEFTDQFAGTAGQREPQVFSDSIGASNLYMWGGAPSGNRLAQCKLDQGRARLGLEQTAGSNDCDGARIDIVYNGMTIASGGMVVFETADASAFQNIQCSDAHIEGDAIISGQVNASGPLQCNGSIQTSASAFQMTNAVGGGWRDLNAGSINSNGSIMATNNLGFQGPTTGSFTANVNWNSASGNFRVNTSSRRFKENIEDADLDTQKVLALRPRSFERNDEKDDEGNPIRTGHRYVGFIAEEAADLGLDEFVVRDAEGEPWSFAYDYWAVAQQAVIRKQAEQIADLTARIERLENNQPTRNTTTQEQDNE